MATPPGLVLAGSSHQNLEPTERREPQGNITARSWLVSSPTPLQKPSGGECSITLGSGSWKQC